MSAGTPESPVRIGGTPDLYDPPTADELKGESPLEGLRKALAKKAQKPILPLRVPNRPGVGLRFDPNFEDTERKAWQKRATRKRRGQDDVVDDMLFASLVIANRNVAITFGGVEATDEEGTPLTFRHAELRQMLGATDPEDCIRKLFGSDAHVLMASGEITLAAGFDDDLTEDPTEGSSVD